MNLAQLRYLVELAKYENYTYTAKQLNITQPSLSNAIKSLEEEIKVPLFKKQGRNVVLTEYGKTFSTDISQGLRTIDHAVEKVQNMSLQRTTLRVASLRSLSTQWVPELVQRYLNLYPDDRGALQFRFSGSTGFSTDILAELQAGQYDISFCAEDGQPKGISLHPVIRQSIVLITAEDHQLAERNSVTLKELQDYEYISFVTRSAAYKLFKQMFTSAPVAPSIVAYGENLQTVAGLVSNHFGIAIVPYATVLKDLPVAVIPIKGDFNSRMLYMATRKDQKPSILTDKFIHFVKQQPLKELKP